MKKPNEYDVASLDDLCNLVTDENIEVLSADLTEWLKSYLIAIKVTRQLCPKETKGKKNTEIMKGGFTWIDDGESKLRGFVVEDEDGGKTTVKF